MCATFKRDFACQRKIVWERNQSNETINICLTRVMDLLNNNIYMRDPHVKIIRNLMFWQTIEFCKSQSLNSFEFGRTAHFYCNTHTIPFLFFFFFQAPRWNRFIRLKSKIVNYFTFDIIFLLKFRKYIKMWLSRNESHVLCIYKI